MSTLDAILVAHRTPEYPEQAIAHLAYVFCGDLFTPFELEIKSAEVIGDKGGVAKEKGEEVTRRAPRRLLCIVGKGICKECVENHSLAWRYFCRLGPRKAKTET